MSFDVILPFLRPIAHLIEDPDTTEITVDGSRRGTRSNQQAYFCWLNRLPIAAVPTSIT